MGSRYHTIALGSFQREPKKKRGRKKEPYFYHNFLKRDRSWTTARPLSTPRLHSSPPRIYHCHRLLSPATTSTATVSNLMFRFHVCVHFSTPPLSIHLARFLHWLTSKTSRLWQPSTTASTPTPVTRTHPRTESSRSSSRCRPIALSDESDTADPQNDSFKMDRCGQPSERTSVAVSDKAQQKDYM